MADTTITGMPGGPASALTGTEVFPCDQAGTSKKASANQIKTFIGASPLQVSDGTTTVSSVTDINVTGAVVSSGGAGIADLAISGGGGGGGTPTGAAYFLASTQSIPDSTQTVVNFDTHGTSSFDTGSYHGAGSGKFTVPATGLYVVTAAVQWDTGSAGAREVAFIVNGAATPRIALATSAAVGNNEAICTSAVLSLTAADTVQLQVYQSSGGALNVLATEHATYFSIARLTSPVSTAAGYPLTFVQWYPFFGTSNATTYSVVFPQAAAASGNTLFMLVSADGSGTFTAPAGWTVDINQQQSTYARLILMHKTSAADTAALLTSSNVTTFAGFFFEVSGAHALDQFSAGGVAIQQFLALPSITPSAGAAVFGAIAYVSNTSVGDVQANEPPTSPTWKLDYIQGPGSIAGRGLLLLEYLQASAASVTTPPYLQFPVWSFYASSGLAYATFSIL